ARIQTTNGVEVRFYTTLCGEYGPQYIILEGSKGTMRWSVSNELLWSNDRGEWKFTCDAENRMKNMYLNLIDAIEGRCNRYSPVDACRSFVLAGNGAFESSRRVYQIPDDHLQVTKEDHTVAVKIRNIEEIIAKAEKTGKLFSELGVEWA